MTLGEWRYNDGSRESSPVPLNYSASIKSLINQKIKNIKKQKSEAFDNSFKNRQRSQSRQKLEKLNVTMTAAPSMHRLPIKEQSVTNTGLLLPKIQQTKGTFTPGINGLSPAKMSQKYLLPVAKKNSTLITSSPRKTSIAVSPAKPSNTGSPAGSKAKLNRIV